MSNMWRPLLVFVKLALIALIPRLAANIFAQRFAIFLKLYNKTPFS